MTERLEGLYSSYGHQCGCGGDSPSTGAQIARLSQSGDKAKHNPPEPRSSVSKKAYRWVYKAGGMTPEMLSDRPIRKMIEETSSSLSTALDEDIAQELTPEMRNALERDVFLFSGFKTYHNLKEASLLLENKERGGIRTFDEFYRSIRQIDDKYNRDWLRSEYQFAVNSAAMASQWEQALKDKDLYALQYVTVGDDRVRPEHAELDGLVLPMDDPFWRTGTPPNGWGCRCTVMQVPLEENPLTPQEQSDRSRAASSALNDMTEGKNSIFRFNPYYDQALFPPKHPYFGKKGYRHCSSDRFAHADGDADPCNIYRKLKETAEKKQAEGKQKKESTEAKRELLSTIRKKKIYYKEFGNRTASIVRNSVTENLEYGELFPVKKEILYSLDKYLASEYEFRYSQNVKPEKEGKVKGYFVFTVDYIGNNPLAVGRKVELHFEEREKNEGGSIVLHFIKII